MSDEFISEDEWLERFKPIAEKSDVWVDDPDFEQAFQERRLWTAVTDDYDDLVYTSGFHYVNRQFYVYCEVPYEEGKDYTVINDSMPRVLIFEDDGMVMAFKCETSDGAEAESLLAAAYPNAELLYMQVSDSVEDVLKFYRENG
jgi:hypothetical protein